MPSFHYEALETDGQVVLGDVTADDVQQAIEILQARGLRVQSIELAGATAEPSTADGRNKGQAVASSTPRPDGEGVERAVLRAHMATILERGRVIAPALRAYAEEMPTSWQQRQLLSVCQILERGDPSEAATALAEMPECWIPLLSAATASADPGHVLHEFLEESRRTDELRQKWWLTLAYPLILLALATVVMTLLSIFVIPGFRDIFMDFGLILPNFTILMLNVAEFLSNWGMVLIVFLVALFLLLVLKANRLLPASAFAWSGDRFRLPFRRRTAVARFARFMADLLEAGVSTPDALRIAGFTVNQSRMKRAAWNLAYDMESAGEFSPLAYRRPLTATVAYALAPGTPRASQVRMLRDISSCHAERVQSGMSWTRGIVQPLGVFVVGFVVAWIVVALFLPLVKLVEGL